MIPTTSEKKEDGGDDLAVYEFQGAWDGELWQGVGSHGRGWGAMAGAINNESEDDDDDTMTMTTMTTVVASKT